MKLFVIGLLLTTLAFINTGATGDEDEEDLMDVDVYIGNADIRKALRAIGAMRLKDGASKSSIWRLTSGKRIDAKRCWKDGLNVPKCQNGNCVTNGPRGSILIAETPGTCDVFCQLFDPDITCKTQICCLEVKERFCQRNENTIYQGEYLERYNVNMALGGRGECECERLCLEYKNPDHPDHECNHATWDLNYVISGAGEKFNCFLFKDFEAVSANTPNAIGFTTFDCR